MKILKFGTKNAIFRLKFEKPVVIFEISTNEFPNLRPKIWVLCKTNAKVCIKQKKWICDQNALFLVFWGCSFEKLLSYFKSALYGKKAKLRAKIKVPKFGTKNALC